MIIACLVDARSTLGVMVTIVGIACWDTVLAAAKIPDRGDKLRVRPLVSAPGGDAANTAARLAALDIPTTLVPDWATTQPGPVSELRAAVLLLCASYANRSLTQLRRPCSWNQTASERFCMSNRTRA